MDSFVGIEDAPSKNDSSCWVRATWLAFVGRHLVAEHWHLEFTFKVYRI